MMKSIKAAWLLSLLVLTLPVMAAEDKPAVDPAYTWDLTELYPSVEAWSEARDEVLAGLEKVIARRGTLGESAEDL